MNKTFLGNEYDVFELNGDSKGKRIGIRQAVTEFVQSHNLTENTYNELISFVGDFKQETVNDAEHLYISMEKIVTDVKVNDEIHSNGNDSAMESVVTNTKIEVDSEDVSEVYLLMTYDI